MGLYLFSEAAILVLLREPLIAYGLGRVNSVQAGLPKNPKSRLAWLNNRVTVGGAGVIKHITDLKAPNSTAKTTLIHQKLERTESEAKNLCEDS